MKKLLLVGVLISLLAPAIVIAQSALDGTWKFDLSKSQLPKKPDVYLLQNGIYECQTCAPPLKIRANGQDQKITGEPYYDNVSIRIVDDRTIEQIEKKNGKTVVVAKTTVSTDGKTAHYEFIDRSATNAEPVNGKGELTRVAEGPAGAHAISGTWRTTKLENFSDNGIMVTFKTVGDTLTMVNPIGQNYTARLDGTEAPYKGDPGTTTVSVKRMGTNGIEETDRLHGKPTHIFRMTVADDGKTMTVAVNDKLHGTTSEYIAEKQ